MERIIYLDNSATTKPFAEVEQFYKEQMDNFYNPSALYAPAVSVRKKIEQARKHIAELLGGENGTLYFTSGATEANNLALGGVNYAGGAELVVSEGEHPSVYAKAKSLQNSGVVVKYLPLEDTGKVQAIAINKYVTNKTALISVMLVSNEVGAINNIKEMVTQAKKINPKVLFHVDGVQAVGKIPVDLMDLGVDLFTISAHKIHGPKGVGALWVKKGINIHPLVFGGGQELGLRSGTENTAGILAFEYALQKVIRDLHSNYKKVKNDKDKLFELLQNNQVEIINNSTDSSPYILSLSIFGLRGEVLVHELEKFNIYISTGSACSSKKPDNRTLIAMKRTEEQIKGTIRISFSAYDDYDIDYIANIMSQEITKLKTKISGK